MQPGPPCEACGGAHETASCSGLDAWLGERRRASLAGSDPGLRRDVEARMGILVQAVSPWRPDGVERRAEAEIGAANEETLVLLRLDGKAGPGGSGGPERE